MSVKLRSSVFGFNRDDVLEYIHKKDADMKILSVSLNNKISALEDELSSLKAKSNELENENIILKDSNSELNSQLSVYKEKEEEIESLSRKIGKLYLISKSSAKSIVDRAEEKASIINDHANVRLNSINETEDALHEIAKQIVLTSEKYVSELNTLEASLAETKKKVTERDAERVRISEEFADIYEKLS